LEAAEEIGAVVGLKESQTKDALSPVLEDLLKPAKVDFLDDDWKPLKRLVRWLVLLM
jgi:hypothetical protein